ncbi:MAG: serine hydrolase domain-containing protein [Bacteroidales bacterium]
MMRFCLRGKLVLIFYFLLLLALPVSCGHRSDSEHFNLEPLPEGNLPLTHSDSLKRGVLEHYFNKLYSRGGFNGNVLVASRGKVIFEGCYGFADHKSKKDLTRETSFQLASVTKQFTAAAILILKERGILSLNDPVEKFIPGFPYKGITIRLLLGHRSGLFNYIYFCDRLVHDKQKPITNDDVLRMINIHQPKPYYEPDRTFNYSNTGYIILAAIVEKVSKLSYGDFLKKEIFDPLGMNHSSVITSHEKKNESIAVGYKGGWRIAPMTFLDGVVGDKGVYSSVVDLYKWDRALYTDKILSRSTLQEAFTPYGKPVTSKRNYGYGWRIDRLPDSTKILYHTGWWEGFQTLLARIEKDSTTIVVLKNKKSGHIDRLGLLKLLYPEIFPDDAGKINGNNEEEENE